MEVMLKSYEFMGLLKDYVKFSLGKNTLKNAGVEYCNERLKKIRELIINEGSNRQVLTLQKIRARIKHELQNRMLKEVMADTLFMTS